MIKRWKFADELVRQGSWMFLATSLGSLFNLLYQVYMRRGLSTEDYGDLNSLLAIFLLISSPLGSLQTVVTKFTSSFHAYNQWIKIKSFLIKLAKRVSFFGLATFLIILLGKGYLSSFFQIPSSGLIVTLGLLLFLSVMLPLTLGGLQGLQMFKWLGLSGIISGGLKLALGILLVSLGFKVMGALFAYIIASLAMFLLSFLPLRGFILENWRLKIASSETNNPGDFPEEINYSQVYKYFLPVFITWLCFMGLVSGDMILVKHFFSRLEAGYYSTAQLVGKIILFLPGAVTIVMFPKVSHLHTQNKNTLPVIKKSLVMVGLLCGGASLVCIFFPAFIIKLLAGRIYPESLPLVWLFTVGMTFFALLYTLLSYQLSIHQLNFIYPLIFFTALQTILLIFFHKTLSQVLYILCGNSILLFSINLRLIKGPKSLRE